MAEEKRFQEDRIEKLLCSDGKERRIYVWEPEKPRAVLLMVHGGMDHGGAYMGPGLFFRKHGMALVAHNQHGHDHLGPDHPSRVIVYGFDAFLADMDLMLARVKLEYPGLPVFIMAHSMGGLVATQWGIRNLEEDPMVRGFILSSPYYVNLIRTAPILKKMVGLIAALLPKMKLPIDSFLEVVTHDKEIYERHVKDEADGIKARESSMSFGHALLKAQNWVPGHISRWEHPILAIVAGEDKLADPDAARELIGRIDPKLVTQLYYPDNYHENFNELNREEIFGEILKWVEQRL